MTIVSSTTANAVTTITAAQAKAIRNADSICFDHATQGGQPVGTLRAILRADNPKNSLGFEQTIYIPVEVSTVSDYSGATGDVTAFSMVQSAQYDHRWLTVAKRIKTGSRLAFHWTRDNSSPVTREAGLVVDMLDVKVYNSSGLSGDVFRMDTYIGYDNTARMVKRG